MYSMFDNLDNPVVTENDHAKKRPAISAVVVAVITKIIIFIANNFKVKLLNRFLLKLNKTDNELFDQNRKVSH